MPTIVEQLKMMRSQSPLLARATNLPASSLRVADPPLIMKSSTTNPSNPTLSKEKNRMLITKMKKMRRLSQW
jgi:hypothetical protein